MKILLIYPSRLSNLEQPMKYRLGFLPPLGLAILTALTPKHHQVKVLNDIVENVDFDSDVDLVGLTAMTTQISRAYQIADEFRRRGKKVVLGGIHPTFFPEEALQHADSVIIGEAEGLWEQLLIDVENHCLKDRYQHKEFCSLDNLPTPDWSNQDLTIYPRMLGAKLPMMPVFTTRGCPYGCKFCAVTKVYGKSYRVRPIADVVREIEATNIREIFFVDDNIACVPEHSKELFRALSGKNISWMSQISTTVLKNPELIDLAADCGCFYLFIGMESLNKDSLKGAKKSFNNVDKYEELIARMHKAGIVPYLSFIFGFDEDLDEQFDLTVEFIRRNKVGYATFWLLTPLPGTDLYWEFLKDGRIVDHNWSHYDANQIVFNSRIEKSELERRYWKGYNKLFSWRSIVANMGNVVKNSRRPFNEFLRSLFYMVYIHIKVSNNDHPFSGGIFRRS
ncbi:MAG: B12-binding domain-containing radical SAM protein [Candidatus Riflebacteria bacterium HGW-Riflebacteria-2]|jgi:radical SAM superfamily enzyme YgiQ (UPF0313 family)|nr:MAG: B12-binding domain-containing radical SAM protein [Candidatus Riflebacteria bacterium HGW-Riflebacteria-2]